jgi:hypothetical protein
MISLHERELFLQKRIENDQNVILSNYYEHLDRILICNYIKEQME